MSDNSAIPSQDQPEIFTDATNRLAAAESPTKSQSSQGILKKGNRKSIGRRVSFAATAHVRVFNEEEGKPQVETEAAAAEAAAAAKQESIEKASKEVEDEMASFRKQFENETDDELKNSLEEFAIKSSPMATKDVSYEGKMALFLLLLLLSFFKNCFIS